MSGSETTELGHSGVVVPALGTGTWSWGDGMVWGYGKGYAETEIRGAYDAAMAGGVGFFDTAELYGRGKSERFLGAFIDSNSPVPPVATKFMPLPWRTSRTSLSSALRASLGRLGLARVDLYQIHSPLPPQPVEKWAEALADAVEAGLTRAVGVSNYSVDQMRRTHERLRQRGIPLASNQVEYSLLKRAPEQNGLLQTAQELGVTIIAYSPLAMGALTGKYSAGNPPQGARRRLYGSSTLQRIAPLLALLRELGESHGVSPAQVALNWLLCRGAIPIPGAKTAEQARHNAGALGWRLTPSEMASLDAVSDQVGKQHRAGRSRP